MSNIILPKVQILDTIGDEAKILIEQDGEINRFAVANLGGGDISINLEDTIYGDANPINADTLGGYPVETFVKQNEIVDRVIYGKGKNLLKNTAKSQTINGVTFTVNEDGSVIVNGTATDDVDFWLTNEHYGSTNAIIQPGEYTISGATGAVYLIFGHGTNSKHTMNENTLTRVLDDGIAWCSLKVNKDDTVNNYVAYPMIRLASETDDTYEPYYEGLVKMPNKLSVELLWKNGQPESTFVEQTINLDLSPYSHLAVEFSPIGTSYKKTQFCNVGGRCILDAVYGSAGMSGSYVFSIWRNMSTTVTSVSFTQAVKSDQKNTATKIETQDAYAIPTKIYGIKGVSA